LPGSAADPGRESARGLEWREAIDPDDALPFFVRWECIAKNRYYEVRVETDLFGYWVLTNAWGGKGLTSVGF